MKDVAAVHKKLAPGLVLHVTLENNMRRVVFANGLEIDELIVTSDDVQRRLVYAVLNRARHHRCRFVWITDVMPDDAAARFASVMDQALPIIQQTLEQNSTRHA